MTQRTCDISGRTSDGKHYLIPTTEGTDVVSPRALFGADDSYARRLIRELTERVEALEAQITAEQQDTGPEPEPAKASRSRKGA